MLSCRLGHFEKRFVGGPKYAKLNYVKSAYSPAFPELVPVLGLISLKTSSSGVVARTTLSTITTLKHIKPQVSQFTSRENGEDHP